jgi:hypothetical protein
MLRFLEPFYQVLLPDRGQCMGSVPPCLGALRHDDRLGVLDVLGAFFQTSAPSLRIIIRPKERRRTELERDESLN